MTIFNRILIIVCLFAAFSVDAFAALPNISQAIETKLYQGTKEEIASFIEARQVQIDQLVSEIETIISRQREISAEQEPLTNAVAVLHGLSTQFQRLESEINKSGDLTIKVPGLGPAPYTLTVLNSIKSFQREVEQQLKEDIKNIDRLDRKLSTIKKNLESLLFNYSGMKKSDSYLFLAYEKAAHIFSLQVEYSLLKLRLSRLQKQSDSLQGLQKEGLKLIKICLEKIMVTQDDVALAKKKFEDLNLQKTRFLEKMQKERDILDGKLLHYELQMENVETNLEKAGQDNITTLFLKIEKKRIASIIETIQVKQQGLDQKKLDLEIKIIDASFTYDRLQYYGGATAQKSLREIIKTGRDKQDYLDTTTKSLAEMLSETSLGKYRLTQKLVTVSDERKTASEKKIQDALAALERQLLKTNELTDELIAIITANQKDIGVLFDEIRWSLDFMLKEMPWYENIRIYFEKNLLKSWENVKNVFYYPLLTVGETIITLASILKSIILLTACLFLLRLARRKSSALLLLKTNMSYGSVTSVTTLGYYVALVLGIFIILAIMGVNISQITVIVGALGVGIGFGLQTIANNFVSGIILLSEQTIKAGDIVNLESGVTGEVKKVAIRSTIIRTIDGNDIIVPNSEFVSGRVNTWTYGDDWRRLTIPFGVSYGSEPDEIVRLAKEAAREVEITREDIKHPVLVFFEGYGESSLDFSIKVWCRMYRLASHSGLRSDYYFALFRKLKEAGVEIPFPQRDLRLRSVSPEVSSLLRKNYIKDVTEL